MGQLLPRFRTQYLSLISSELLTFELLTRETLHATSLL